jgi:hypothetical protein
MLGHAIEISARQGRDSDARAISLDVRPSTRRRAQATGLHGIRRRQLRRCPNNVRKRAPFELLQGHAAVIMLGSTQGRSRATDRRARQRGVCARDKDADAEKKADQTTRDVRHGK